MKELRCAFVGCGGAGLAYLDAYRSLPGVQIAACIDIDLERAQCAARSFARYNAAGERQPVRVSADFADALTSDVDLLVVSTPNHLHRDQAIAALKHDKHVFLQKPLASTLEDAVAILQATRESKAHAGVYMSYFDHPIIHDFREMVLRGWFGEVTQMHGSLMHSGGLLWTKEIAAGKPASWRGSVRLTGGGAFIQLAVHYIRMMCWIIGKRVQSIMGFASNRMCPGIEGEDTAVAILELEGGMVATLNVSWCGEGEEFSIHGTQGSLTHLNNQYTRLQSEHSYEGDAICYVAPGLQHIENLPVDRSDANQPYNQHRIFLEEIRSGKPAFVSIETAVQDMMVVDAFYESVRTGKKVLIAPSSASVCTA